MHVRYEGLVEVIVPSLSAVAHQPIKPGDVVSAPEGFNHPHFAETDEDPTNVRDLAAEQEAEAARVRAEHEAKDEDDVAAPAAQDEETE